MSSTQKLKGEMTGIQRSTTIRNKSKLEMTSVNQLKMTGVNQLKMTGVNRLNSERFLSI